MVVVWLVTTATDFNRCDRDFIWLTHHSFDCSYRAAEEFHCLSWMMPMIVCPHWFEASSYFPLVNWLLDYWHAYGCHLFCRFYQKMPPNYCHLMNSSRSIAEYCSVAIGIDCRDRLKKLDWLAVGEEDTKQMNSIVNNDRMIFDRCDHIKCV